VSRRRIGPQSEQAEIDLGHLAGWRLDDPRRHRRRPEPPLAPREAMQRAVGNPHVLSCQPPMDFVNRSPSASQALDLSRWAVSRSASAAGRPALCCLVS
jgi:hypothetical protein